MKPYIQITQPNGMVYEIKAEDIAKHRAHSLMKLLPDQFPTIHAAMNEAISTFNSDEAMQLWMRQHMTHQDICAMRRFVHAAPQNPPAWHEGEWKHSDTKAEVIPISGDALMATPLEITAAGMAASRQLCSIAVTADEKTQQPIAAIVVIVGDKRAIDTYCHVLQTATDAIIAAEQIADGNLQPMPDAIQ